MLNLQVSSCLYPDWFSENIVPAGAPSVSSAFIFRRLKIIIGGKIVSCRTQITTAEKTPCSVNLTAQNYSYLFSQRILLSFCQQLPFQLQNNYKSVHHLWHSSTTNAVHIWWVEGLSSRSIGCLTSLHNLAWNFLTTCNLLSTVKAVALLNEYLVLVLQVSSKARYRTSLIVKPKTYSGFSVWISLIPPAFRAEDRVFRIKELPVFESSVFLFVTVLRNAILELMKTYLPSCNSFHRFLQLQELAALYFSSFFFRRTLCSDTG